MASVLSAFLARAAGEPHQWGQWDCCMLLANWVRENTGVDPAADLRGTYHSEFGWRRILAREGAMVEVVRKRLLAAGLTETAPGEAIRLEDVPEIIRGFRAGDLAVVMIPSVGPTGAIFTGRGFAAKLDSGLMRVPAVPLAGWRM